MASNNRVIALGHLKGPGAFISDTTRRFLCSKQSCPGGGSKARPDELQRHVAKVHGEIIDYSAVIIQERNPVTGVVTTLTAAQYVDRTWAAAGLAVPPPLRFRTPGPIAATTPSNIHPPTIPAIIPVNTNTFSEEELSDPRLAVFRDLVRMTTNMARWLVEEEGMDGTRLQTFADHVMDEAGRAIVDEEVQEDE